MIIMDIEQGTPEWFAVRSLRMTASHAQAIGANGKGLESYILEMVADHFSNAEKIHYSNEHTERGNKLEPEARSLYELDQSVEVQQVGFIVLDEYAGCSPDGIVSAKGLVEFKCPSDKVYFRRLIGDDKIDTQYIWQIQMQMYVTSREWCDYVEYNPNYAKSLYIQRVYRDESKINKIIAGLATGKAQIIDLVKKYEEANQNI